MDLSFNDEKVCAAWCQRGGTDVGDKTHEADEQLKDREETSHLIKFSTNE